MGLSLSKRPESDSVARLGRTQLSVTCVSRVSEDEIELRGDFEKPPLPEGGIHVTRTIAIET